MRFTGRELRGFEKFLCPKNGRLLNAGLAIGRLLHIILLAGFLRGVLRFLVRVLGSLVRFGGILHSLLGVFVSG
jgi:hypothetical protein